MWRLALTSHLRDSYEFFATNFCHITDKRGRMTTLKPFVGQAIHRVALDSQLRAGLPGRLVEVKARQLGWTVENIARALHYVLDENRRAIILVDDEDVAAEQARRLGTMLNYLPGWMQPMRRIQNLKHLVFDNPNPKDRRENPGLESAFQITVPASMRGVPQGFVCISEYSFMDEDRQDEVQAGVISAAPMTTNSIIIIDTTPNGMVDNGQAYYEMVMDAVEDNPKWTKRIEEWKGELTVQDVYGGVLGIPDTVARGYPGVYVTAVCPWRLHPEYSCKAKATPLGELRPLTKAHRGETESSLGKLSKYGGEEEIYLRDKYELSTERAFWRRRKIDGYKVPTEEMALLMFRQEFLSDIASAFIDSGTAPFDRASMDALARQEREPLAVGLFIGEDKFDHQHPENLQWQNIRIYAPPQNGEKYTMGIDTDVAYESPDSDATVAQVVRFRDNKVVATYEARVPEYILRQQLFWLYRWYFNCYYAVELKGMGYQLTRTLLDMGMNNVHYWKRYDRDVPDSTNYPGWETNAKTRPLMDQTATALICRRNPDSGAVDPDIIIPDAKTIREIRGLTRTDTGAFKSSRGHDDHWDALCIALCIARDSYSGLHRQNVVEEEARRAEFERRFYDLTRMGVTSRNHPSLSEL
jgi:hypothetical protein